MPGLAPFMKHFRDQTVGAHAYVSSTDDQVMGFDVTDLGFFVGRDPLVLIVPFRQEKTNGTTDELRQVSNDEPCVFPRELDLATEGKVVAYEHTGAGDNTCGELFVVTVTKTKNPAVIITGLLCVNLHQAKIAHTVMGKRMSLSSDAEAGGFEGLLDRGDEFVMGYGMPGFSGVGSGNLADIFEVHMGSAAVKDEVGSAALNNNWGRGGCVGDHDVLRVYEVWSVRVFQPCARFFG